MTQPEQTPRERRLQPRNEPPRRVVPEWVRRMHEGQHPAKDMTKVAA